MARSYAKSAEVKRGILEACVSAFGENGFHGASMAEIARRAGISHTGMLHHFPRKEDLLTAVLAMQDQRTARFIAAQTTLDIETDPVAVLRGMIASMADRSRHPGLVQLSVVLTGEASVPSHPAHGYFAERFANVRAFLTRLYAALDGRGLLRGEHAPAALAASTISVAEGLLIQHLYAPGTIDVESAMFQHIAAFVVGFDDEGRH